MADVKRYEKRVNPINGNVYMACVPDGAYVLYSDYEALSHAAGQDGEQCRAASGDADLGTWLWGKLMDFCQKRRMPLAEYNDLFEIVDELRALSRGVPEGK